MNPYIDFYISASEHRPILCPDHDGSKSKSRLKCISEHGPRDYAVPGYTFSQWSSQILCITPFVVESKITHQILFFIRTFEIV